MTAFEIRKTFLDFFQNKQHKIVASDPIVLKNDPTLMFTNAGMNQFKDYFLGVRKPEYRRIADTQKCLRVSGKHNDLEEVGVDTYHHTMFEMLGNWSFGDYFKVEAIAWSWELLTEVFKIDKDRLYVTVFEGDAKENLDFDIEAESEWKKWIAADRILKGNKKDNFWEMGDTGPCGPCTEIHVDMRSDEERKAVDGKTLVNNDHPQVIEIWNNVFIQYNRKADGSLEPLADKHVDTGMGFERLVRCLQGKSSNYDTDVFQPMIRFVESKTNLQYGKNEATDIAMRVLSDHIRAISFCIADGQLPSNTGAGYVIRRILRRAVRYYFSTLNYKKPLLTEMVDVLAIQFKDVFPELYLQKDLVSKVILEEENSFLSTLDKGLKKMDEFEIKKKISGQEAFELYDTFGFPFDLTCLIAKEKNIEIDPAGFTAAMEQQKNRSRQATSIETGDWHEISVVKESNFVGYDTLNTDSKILRYRKMNIKGKDAYQLVLDTTPFYAESGGQIGDTGILTVGDEEILVLDTKKENNQIIHYVDKIPTHLDAKIAARVDAKRRRAIENNHSVTHLLHSALRQVLGNHIAQKGSYVGPDRLRFDFSHFSKIEPQQIADIELIVNEKIRENIALDEKRDMPIADAQAMGATALFGEKYGDKVRVITFDPSYSIELCGGTHTPATGTIGYFKLLSESSVAAGVRRVEAITAAETEAFFNVQLDSLEKIKTLLKNPKDTAAQLEKLLEEKKKMEARMKELEMLEVEKYKNRLVMGIADAKIVFQTQEEWNANSLKMAITQVINEKSIQAVILADKNIFICQIDTAFAKEKNIDLNALLKAYSQEVRGGGSKTMISVNGLSEVDQKNLIQYFNEKL